MSDFYTDKARGKTGESIFKDYCKMNRLQWQDVTEDWDYRNQEIDFIVNGKTYEVKTDYRYQNTGNLAVELMTYYNDGGTRQGWLWSSTADYIAYVIPQTKDIYIIPLLELRDLCGECTTRTHRDNRKWIEFFILPLHKYINHFTHKHGWVF